MNDSLPLLVANFKAHKTWNEIQPWIEEIGTSTLSFPGTIIVSLSFPFLPQSSWLIKSKNLKIKISSQDISMFEQGAYTGEVAASQLSNICNYAIIGHSERRQNFKENQEMLEKKVKNAKNADIEPIFCVQDSTMQIPDNVKIVAYEPVFAIGTGNPDTPQNAKNIAKTIKQKGIDIVLYGGSVSGANVKSFLEKNLIDGVLVGSSSLEASDFLKIVESSK